MRILCDNSKCSTAVKSFKLKFKRKIFLIGERRDANNQLVRTLNKQSKYLYQHKDQGCGAKTKVERVLTFDIPKIDYDYPESLSLGADNAFVNEMQQQMQASCNGYLFSV